MKDSNKYKVYRAFTAVGRWVLFAVVAFLILFPVLWIFISSITPPGELFKMPIDYIPDHPTPVSYTHLPKLPVYPLFPYIQKVTCPISS